MKLKEMRTETLKELDLVASVMAKTDTVESANNFYQQGKGILAIALRLSIIDFGEYSILSSALVNTFVDIKLSLGGEN